MFISILSQNKSLSSQGQLNHGKGPQSRVESLARENLIKPAKWFTTKSLSMWREMGLINCLQTEDDAGEQVWHISEIS
jgi:hypothetical protein